MARKDPVSHLRRFADGAPARLLDEIRGLGPDAVPALEEVLRHGEARVPGTPACTAATNAAALYGELAGPRAVRLLVDLVLTAPIDTPLQAAAMWGLWRVAEPEAMVEGVLAAAVDPERERHVVEILARSGVHRPEIRARIVERLGVDAKHGAQLAVLYEDPTLVSELRAAFDAHVFPHPPDDVALVIGSAMVRAIDALGSAAEDDARHHRFVGALSLRVQAAEHELRELKERFGRG